jgi:hypothetical protein
MPLPTVSCDRMVTLFLNTICFDTEKINVMSSNDCLSILECIEINERIVLSELHLRYDKHKKNPNSGRLKSINSMHFWSYESFTEIKLPTKVSPSVLLNRDFRKENIISFECGKKTSFLRNINVSFQNPVQLDAIMRWECSRCIILFSSTICFLCDSSKWVNFLVILCD